MLMAYLPAAPVMIIGVIAFLGLLRLKDAAVDYAARDFRRDARVGRIVRNLIVGGIGVIWLLHLLRPGR